MDSFGVRKFRKRLRYILNRGWSMLYVFGEPADFAQVNEKLISWFETTRFDESTRGKYGMIRCNPKSRSVRCTKFDGFPRVVGF